MTAVSVVCLILMIMLFGYVAGKFLKTDRKDKLKFLKSFKKGKFVLIYLVAVPLYWMGIVYKGEPVGGALLMAIKATVDMVVLKYDYSSAAALMSDNLIYRITMDVCFVMVALNALLFTFTIVGERIANKVRVNLAARGKDELFVIIGYNAENRQILQSVTEAGGKALVLDKVTAELQDEMFVAKAGLVAFGAGDDAGKTLKKLLGATDGRKITVIINTGDDVKGILITGQLCDMILADGLDTKSFEREKGFSVYTFGAPQNKSAFIHFVEKSQGTIAYVDKYKLIALDFVSRYPLTAFMSADELDYDKGLLKSDVQLNVVMVGFGKTNQQLFLTSVANNQFITQGAAGPEVKTVRYNIYDKEDSKNDKNLNHTYYRYSNEFSGKAADGKEYLPLPAEPAEVHFRKMNINDTEFYKSLRLSLSADAGNKPFNYVIIAFGKDTENLDLADKLSLKLKEWGLADRTKLFVKIRDNALSKRIIAEEINKEEGFIPFGNEKAVVYNISSIADESTEKMARFKHFTYAVVDYLKSHPSENDAEIRDILRSAAEKWYKKWVQVQRDSNVYACLSIRSKLNMAGFDFAAASSPEPDAEDEFYLKYQQGNPIVPDPEFAGKTFLGKSIIAYDNDFKKDTLRANMAVQEHYRWNAYMISSGIIPSSVEQIKSEGGKNLALRRHGNITTMQGLVEYRKIMAALNGTDEDREDVIRYDYQLMDDAGWLLKKNGCKIIKRGE